MKYQNNPVNKDIYLNVKAAECQVDNCQNWQQSQYNTCEQWNTGYSLQNESGVNSNGFGTNNLCIIYQESTNQTNNSGKIQIFLRKQISYSF